MGARTGPDVTPKHYYAPRWVPQIDEKFYTVYFAIENREKKKTKKLFIAEISEWRNSTKIYPFLLKQNVVIMTYNFHDKMRSLN